MMPEKDLPTLPAAADLRRDSQMAGCRSPEEQRWRPGLSKDNVVAETVKIQEYDCGDAV